MPVLVEIVLGEAVSPLLSVTASLADYHSSYKDE